MLNLSLINVVHRKSSVSPLLATSTNVNIAHSTFSRSFSPFLSHHSPHLHVYGSFYSNFLNSAIISNAFCHQTLVKTGYNNPNSNLALECTHFFDCHSQNNGGVLFTQTPINITVNQCSFTKCTAANMGGVFYVQKSRIDIHSSCFTDCGVLNQLDNLFGSAILCSNSRVKAGKLLFHQCPSEEQIGGDTVFSTVESEMVARDMNFSMCFPSTGTTSINLFNAVGDSDIRFISSSDSSSWAALEFANSQKITLSHWILRNQQLFLLYNYRQKAGDVIKLEYLYFINVVLTQKLYHAEKAEFENCYGDFEGLLPLDPNNILSLDLSGVPQVCPLNTNIFTGMARAYVDHMVPWVFSVALNWLH